MTISPIKISPKTTTMTPTSSVKGMSEPSASEPSEPLMPLMQVYMRRKFFEPKLMSTPPPIAEQFLYDLRKMISVARERIRNRRHVPRLPPVAESDDETTISAATTANGNCIISGSLQTKSEQIKNGTEENKKEEKIAPNICCLNKENSKEKEKRNSGNLQQKMDYCLVEKKGEEKGEEEEKGEGDIPKEIINEKEEVEITEEGKEEMKEEKEEEKEDKAFIEGIICSETKIDLFNENLELNEIMEEELNELEKEENCGNIEEMKEKDKEGELNDNEFLENDEGKVDKFEKEIDLGREENEEELKKDEEIMPIEDYFDGNSAETTEEEKKTTKSEQVEMTKEIKQSIPLIPQTLPEHQLNNAYIPPPSRIPSAIPSTINGKSPKIPLKFPSSNRKTSSNNCVKPPPLPPRPPPQINGQTNGTTPVMKESFLTVMAAKRKAASGIARRQKQNGRQVFENEIMGVWEI
ncbi:unnamed protein product [Meloidogyne enterolobii]|uniref:Uncharacterized protein n=1 Tax=Meloidogyne enterolobii TaxID=390850 RepID=A0ACB0YL28_MELEN